MWVFRFWLNFDQPLPSDRGPGSVEGPQSAPSGPSMSPCCAFAPTAPPACLLCPSPSFLLNFYPFFELNCSCPATENQAKIAIFGHFSRRPPASHPGHECLLSSPTVGSRRRRLTALPAYTSLRPAGVLSRRSCLHASLGLPHPQRGGQSSAHLTQLDS